MLSVKIEKCVRIIIFLLFYLAIVFKKINRECTVFLLSYRNTSESLGEQEMLWEHKP